MLLKWNSIGLEAIRTFNPVVEEFTRLGLVIDRVQSCSHGRPKTTGTYLILHIKTKKVYVGSHSNLYSRQYQHEHLLRHKKHYAAEFQKAYNDDERLTVMFIQTVDREEAYKLEQCILDKFHSTGLLFNVAKDAKLANKDLTVSAETRQKLSLAAKGRVQDHVWIQKRTQALIGRKLNQQTIEKIREKALTRGINPNLTILAKAKISKPVTVDGTEFDSLTSAASHFCISNSAARKRILSKNPFFSGWNYSNPSGSNPSL